jgi:hypothetical protein
LRGPETPQNGCLPSKLGVEDKGIEIAYGEGKIFVQGRLEQARQNKISCTGTTNPINQPRKEPPH